MKEDNFKYDVNDLIKRYPALSACKDSILEAFRVLKNCFENGHTLYIAGNGGSCSDSEHIVGELMKGFKKVRHLPIEECKKIIEIDPVRGEELSKTLQKGLPCIALNSHPSFNSAFANDVNNGSAMTYAQQLNVLGKEGDVFLAISTSGDSNNVVYSSIVAKAKNMKVIALTGKNGGEISKVANVCVKVPSNETFVVQEFHLPIYHCLCLMLEESLG